MKDMKIILQIKKIYRIFNNTSKCPTNERFTHSYYTDEGGERRRRKDEQKDKAKRTHGAI